MVFVKSFLVLGLLLITPQLAQAQSYNDSTLTNFRYIAPTTSSVPTATGVTAQGNYTPVQAQILGMFFAAINGMGNPEALTEYTGSSSAPFAKYDPLVTMIEGFRSGNQDKVMEGIAALSFPFHNGSNE